MQHFMVTGKVLSVVMNFDSTDDMNAVSLVLENKVYKNGGLKAYRWNIFLHKSKFKWAKTLHEKGYSICVVCDDLLFFDERIFGDNQKFSGYAHATELLTL